MDIAHNPKSFHPFIFHNIQLKEACWVNDEPYFTRRAIGEWLEYPNPRMAIKNIIKRNPHIEDHRWSTVLNLSTVEGKRKIMRDIPVYNPIGFQLIVFESRQPKARAYKIMVANLVWAFMQKRLSPPTKALDFQIMDLALLPKRERAEAVKEFAQDLNKSVSTAYRYIKKIKNNEPIIKGSTKGYVQKRNREALVRARRIHGRFPNMRLIKIADLLNIPNCTIYRWLGGSKKSKSN